MGDGLAGFDGNGALHFNLAEQFTAEVGLTEVRQRGHDGDREQQPGGDGEQAGDDGIT